MKPVTTQRYPTPKYANGPVSKIQMTPSLIIFYFLSTISSSASLAIVLLENAAALLPTTLDGLLTGLPESLLILGELGGCGDVEPEMLFRLMEETKLWTLPPPLEPLANRGPRMPAPAFCPDPERVIVVFPDPKMTSSFGEVGLVLGAGLPRPPRLALQRF